MAEPTFAEIQQAMQRVQDLLALNERHESLLLQIATALSEQQSIQTEQGRALVEALSQIKMDGPQVAMPEMPVQVNVPGNQWKQLHVKVNTDRMGRLESLVIDKVVPMEADD